MFVHHCDRCCVYLKECRPKYRGIWPIFMRKMIFPSKRMNNLVNNRDLNIDQNNRDYNFAHNRAALITAIT